MRDAKNTDRLVPKVRFKGFIDKWEQKEFQDFASRVTIHSSNKKIPNVTFDDIKSNTGVLKTKISELKHGKNGIQFKEKDILFGKLRPYLKNILYSTFEGIAVGDFWVLRSKNSDPNFLYLIIQTSKFNYISNISSGSKMPRSDWNLVSKYKFYIPSEKEQKRIGKLVSYLDTTVLIQDHQHFSTIRTFNILLNQLINQKNTKCMKKVKDVAHISRESINPVTRPNTTFLEYSMPAFDNGKRPVMSFGKDMKSNRLKIQEPVILFNKLNVRKKRIWNITTLKENAVSSAEFIPLSCTNIDQNYLYYALQTDYITYRVRALSTGSSNSQKRITPKDLLELKIPVPELKEQKKIANILQKVEMEINKQNNIKVHLKQIKKFLLQNMFI